MMMALRPLMAIIALFTGVAPGLVEGVTAATTPIGLAYLTMPRAASSSMMPTVFTRSRSRNVPNVLRCFLMILSGTLPRPVSATAISATARARSARRATRPAPAPHRRFVPGWRWRIRVARRERGRRPRRSASPWRCDRLGQHRRRRLFDLAEPWLASPLSPQTVMRGCGHARDRAPGENGQATPSARQCHRSRLVTCAAGLWPSWLSAAREASTNLLF